VSLLAYFLVGALVLMALDGGPDDRKALGIEDGQSRAMAIAAWPLFLLVSCLAGKIK
jgi:hypothetical protein